MLDFTNKRAGGTETGIFGQALAFSMNNTTEDAHITTGHNNNRGAVGDTITACLDSKRQKIVPIGEYYYADPCTLCLCSNAEFMCKQISCAPPEKCDGYIKKEPMHCCDVCVPAVVVERPNDQSSLNLKLGALTVALFLVISLVLFTLHRMRRKRLMVSLRRLQSFRRRDSACSHSGDISGDHRNSVVLRVTDGDLFSTSPPRLFLAADHAAIISESPPPYNAAVTLPRAPEPLARAPPRFTAPVDPPPAYHQAMQDMQTLGRCASQNGHAPTSMVVAGLGRHSRTSDYPDDADYDVEARSTSSYTTTSSSSSSSSFSLSLNSSRESLNIVDEASITADDDYCACSQCDSGLSEERGSLSSNEIRPRSEVLLASCSNYHVVLGQASSEQLLRQTPQPPPMSDSSERYEDRRVRHSGRSINNEGGANSGVSRKNKGKLCKKKLKKLMLKARRKAERGSNDDSRTRPRDAAIDGECSQRARVDEANPNGCHYRSQSRTTNDTVANSSPMTSV